MALSGYESSQIILTSRRSTTALAIESRPCKLTELPNGGRFSGGSPDMEVAPVPTAFIRSHVRRPAPCLLAMFAVMLGVVALAAPAQARRKRLYDLDEGGPGH